MEQSAAIVDSASFDRHAGGEQDELLTNGQRRVGALIDGKYELISLIGIGTTGAVYKAQNKWAGRPCAVKLFHYEGENEEAILRRFVREARAIHQVQLNGKLHPHVVDAIDVGRDRDTGCYFVVQELLRGETLASYLQRIPGRKLQTVNALRVMAPVIDAIACAHRGGVVHRDLKPENVILTRGGADGVFPKVLDFGIAQITEERVTPVNDLMGTPQYMSPEAFAGAGIADARADVWALGVMLYEAISGECPFDHPSEDPMASMELVVQKHPTSLAALGLCPTPLWNVIRRAMAKVTNRRYATAGHLQEALAIAQRPVRILRVSEGMTPAMVRAALSEARGQEPQSPAEPERITLPPQARNSTLVPPSLTVTQRFSSASPRQTTVPSLSVPAPVVPVRVPDEAYLGTPSEYWWSVHVQGAHFSMGRLLDLLAMPELVNVVELHVSGCALGDSGAVRLTESPYLRNLAALTLRGTGISMTGAQALADCADLSSLLKLDLEQNPLGTEGLRCVLAGRFFQNIRSLSIVQTGIDADAGEVLAGWSGLRELQRLDLAQNRLGDRGARLLARRGDFSTELWLSLARNQINPSTATSIGAMLVRRVRKLIF